MAAALCFSNITEVSEQEMNRQRSMEAAQLYLQRRHISQDDTISVHSNNDETESTNTERVSYTIQSEDVRTLEGVTDLANDK